jgi:hypothetical protein
MLGGQVKDAASERPPLTAGCRPRSRRFSVRVIRFRRCAAALANCVEAANPVTNLTGEGAPATPDPR